MHTALWKLYRLRIRGSFRAMAGKLKSVRGAALALFTLLVFGTMFGPSLVMAFTFRPAEAMNPLADSICELIPVAMLLYVVLTILTSLGERAIYFSPSEVDFLFPAPFSRRHILLYKILGSVTAAIFIALLMSTSQIMYLRSWPASAVGFFLAWLMVNSLTMCAQLVAQSVTEQAFTRARKLLLGGLIAAAAVAVGQAAGRGLDDSWRETLLRARHSFAVEILLAPFAVFAKIIAAKRLIPDALGWVALGAILVAGIYALAIRLDANYLETAVRVSRQIQELQAACQERRRFCDAIQERRPKHAAAPAALVGRSRALDLAAVDPVAPWQPRGHDAGRDYGTGRGRALGLWGSPRSSTTNGPASLRYRHRGLCDLSLLVAGSAGVSRRL